jgi:hypothetical protein
MAYPMSLCHIDHDSSLFLILILLPVKNDLYKNMSLRSMLYPMRTFDGLYNSLHICSNHYIKTRERYRSEIHTA